MAESFVCGCVAVTSSSRRASGGRAAPVSALRLPGFSGAVHPGEEGDTIRQLIHASRRGERRDEARFLDHTIPETVRGGAGGEQPLRRAGGGIFHFKVGGLEVVGVFNIKPTLDTKMRL